MLGILYKKDNCILDIVDFSTLGAKIIDDNITNFKKYETDPFVEFTLILKAKNFVSGNYHGVFNVGNANCCNADCYFGNGFTKRINVSCGGYTYKYCKTPPTSGIFVFRLSKQLYRLEVYDLQNLNKVYTDDWNVSYNRQSTYVSVGSHGCATKWEHSNNTIIEKLLFYDKVLTDEEVNNVLNAIGK